MLLDLALLVNIYQKYVWFGRQYGTIHQSVGDANQGLRFSD